MSKKSCVFALAVILITIALPSSAGAAAAAGCNNTGRALDQAPGPTGTPLTTQCAGVTIGPVTLTGPTCTTDVTYRIDSLFRCEGTLECWDCNPRGFKSKWERKQNDAPCPALPTTLEEARELAKTGLNCKPLQVTARDYDWSATNSKCAKKATVPGGGDTVHTIAPSDEELVTAVTGDDLVYWDGDPMAYLGPPPSNPDVEALGTLPTMSPDDLPPALEVAYKSHLPLGQTDVDARVEYDWGETIAELNTYDVSGRLGSDLSFAVSATSIAADPDGGFSSFTEDHSFNGHYFLGYQGNAHYHAYPGGPVAAVAISDSAPFMAPLLRWAADPFSISLQEGSTYSTATTEDGTTLVTAVNSEGDPNLGSLVYTLVGPAQHPVQVDYLDPLGELVRRFASANFVEVSRGNWRPSQMLETRYLPGSATPYLTVTLTVTSAQETATPEPEPVELLSSTGDLWIIHLVQ